MLCATLVYICFLLDGDGPDDAIDALADVIQAVKETCTHLREFLYLHDGEFIPTSTTFETSLDSLIRSSIYLREVSIPTNCRVLDALALLPSLTRLDLTDPLKSSDSGWNVTYSAGPQSPDQETFAALESLNIWSTFTSIDSLHLLLAHFRNIVSKPRVFLSVTIDSRNPRSFAKLPRHLYNVLPPNLRIGLEVLSIDQNRGPDVIAPVHSWQSFSWLLASPHLRRLSLDKYSLEIDDTAFAQMARKWPELQGLHLVISDTSVDPHVTFHGLVHLSLLPKLHHLGITIGPNCTIAPSLLYAEQISTSPLRRLDLRGGFPNADTFQVALFLTKHFPSLDLDTLKTGPEPPWQEVKLRGTFLRKVLPEIPNSRVRLTSGR